MLGQDVTKHRTLPNIISINTKNHGLNLSKCNNFKQLKERKQTLLVTQNSVPPALVKMTNNMEQQSGRPSSKEGKHCNQLSSSISKEKQEAINKQLASQKQWIDEHDSESQLRILSVNNRNSNVRRNSEVNAKLRAFQQTFQKLANLNHKKIPYHLNEEQKIQQRINTLAKEVKILRQKKDTSSSSKYYGNQVMHSRNTPDLSSQVYKTDLVNTPKVWKLQTREDISKISNKFYHCNEISPRAPPLERIVPDFSRKDRNENKSINIYNSLKRNATESIETLNKQQTMEQYSNHMKSFNYPEYYEVKQNIFTSHREKLLEQKQQRFVRPSINLPNGLYKHGNHHIDLNNTIPNLILL